MPVSTVGLDLAKQVFHVAASVLRERGPENAPSTVGGHDAFQHAVRLPYWH